MDLRPQDVVVVLKLLGRAHPIWTYARLGQELSMSASQVFRSIERATHANLLSHLPPPPEAPDLKGISRSPFFASPNRSNLKEFLIHGIKYAFPVERGGLTRGIPTAESAAPIKEYFSDSSVRGLESSQLYKEFFPEASPLPSVWPHPEGSVRGIEFSPLYKNVPTLVSRELRESQHPKLYPLLALVDVIREGRAREREIAIRELTERIDSA